MGYQSQEPLPVIDADDADISAATNELATTADEAIAIFKGQHARYGAPEGRYSARVESVLINARRTRPQDPQVDAWVVRVESVEDDE